MIILLGALLAIGAGEAALLLMCPALVGIIVFGIWSLVVLIQFRSRLATAAAQAQIQYAGPNPDTPSL